MIRWVAALLTALATLAASATVTAAAERRELVFRTWRVVCWPASDEFALACQAVAESRGVRVKLETGDSQLFASISAKGCREGDYANWWRDELAGDPAAAQRRIARALREKARAAHCPTLSGARLVFIAMPDVAGVGDPPPRWVTLRDRLPDD